MFLQKIWAIKEPKFYVGLTRKLSRFEFIITISHFSNEKSFELSSSKCEICQRIFVLQFWRRRRYMVSFCWHKMHLIYQISSHKCSLIYTYKNEIPYVCMYVRSSFIAGQRFDRRYTYLVLARSPISWERFRPGFVPFGRFWPELRAIKGSKVEKW